MNSDVLKPQASSTPNMVKRVTGRKGIHRLYPDLEDLPSPVVQVLTDYIKQTKPEATEEPLITFESANVQLYNCKKANETKENKPENNSKTNHDGLSIIYYYLTTYKERISNAMLYLIVALIVLIPSYPVLTNKPSIVNNLKLKYPTQDPRLWVYFSSGISDTQRFNKPSVIIVMYTDESESIAEEITRNMSEYACTELSDLENPIVLYSSDLNIAEYLEDYGRIIADFKPRLEERRVMVVNDFDKLDAKVARAFHSLCDEYTPLVERAFFIFTVKVRSYVGREVDQIGDILRGRWRELDEDILDPLIARVTNVVLRIAPE